MFRRAMQLLVLLAIGAMIVPQAAIAGAPSARPIFVEPGSTPPLPEGVEVIDSGFLAPIGQGADLVTADSGKSRGPQSMAAGNVEPMWWCAYNCLHVRNLVYVFDVYHGQGVVAKATNYKDTADSLTFSIGVSVANTYSRTTTAKWPILGSELSVALGWSVTLTGTRSYGYVATVDPHKTVCISVSAVYKRFNFEVWQDQFIGEEQYKGVGWAERYYTPYFVAYYCSI